MGEVVHLDWPVCPYGCGERREAHGLEADILDVWKRHDEECPAVKHCGIIAMLREVARSLERGELDQCVVLLLRDPKERRGSDRQKRLTAYVQTGFEDVAVGLLIRTTEEKVDLVGLGRSEAEDLEKSRDRT